MTLPKAKTTEELRDQLLAHVKTIVHSWATRGQSVEEAANGVAFSMLSMIDGCSGLPCIDLVARPHPDDKQFLIDNDEDYIEDGTVINDGVALHEMYYKHE